MVDVQIQILEQLTVVKEKVEEIDRELHSLREDFESNRLTDEEIELLKETLKEENEGKLIKWEDAKKQLGL